MNFTAFQRFVASSGLTNLADGVATVAWAWTASLLTRDPILISLVAVALRSPWFFLALPAGIITDRVSRLRLIRQMDALRGGVFIVLAVLLWQALPLADAPDRGVSAWLPYIALMLSALIVGSAEVFRDNAAQTMLPALVPPEGLEAANGKLWSVELVGNALLGPAIGAFLIAVALPLPFALNALAFLVALALLRHIPSQAAPARTGPSNWRAELKDGFTFLQANPLLRHLAWITGFWNLFFQMVMIALVLHVQDNLDLGARAYGLILAFGAVGGILGGWMASGIVDRLGPGRTAQLMLVASPISFAAMALADGPVMLAIVLAVFEFTGLVWNTVSVSYRQRQIPDALLGRVNSIYRLLAWGMMPVGLLLSGLIVQFSDTFMAHAIALTVPFWVATLGAAMVGLVGWGALGRGFGSTEGR